MRLRSIEFIPRKNGFFRFRDRLIPSVRSGCGVGVAVFFQPSQLDKDFAEVLGYPVNLWFPTAKELENILVALDESDDRTAQMLPVKEWGGVRPRSMKLADLM